MNIKQKLLRLLKIKIDAHITLTIDMGLGKTFVGSSKLSTFEFNYALVVCPKPLVDNWINHFKEYYPQYEVIDCTKKKFSIKPGILVINYDLIWRRPELYKLKKLSVILDESSLIQNPNTKRTRAIFKLDIQNIILLSGTPTAGKYEKLWTQCKLLGWNISKGMYDETYINWRKLNINGFPIKVVDKYNPYKNVQQLKSKLKEHGAVFLKTEDVLTLPEQVFYTIESNAPKCYKAFLKDKIVKIKNEEFIGDTILTQLLYCRLLAGAYNQNKLSQFKTLLDSTEDRLIVFYNFEKELNELISICEESNKHISQICGRVKDIENYETHSDTITLIQYQSGSMGFNLQKANKIIYFSPPLNCEHWMQSLKRIHRIGQKDTCFYYKLVAKNTVEEKIYKSLETGENYTNELFRKDLGV